MFSSLPPSFYLRLLLVLMFCLSPCVTAALWYPVHAAPGSTALSHSLQAPRPWEREAAVTHAAVHVCMGVHVDVHLGVHAWVRMHVCRHVIPTSTAALALGSHFAGCLRWGGLR